jgi:hypothetical protein
LRNFQVMSEKFNVNGLCVKQKFLTNIIIIKIIKLSP